MVNILLIGCGYHARRIYVPHLIEQRNATLCAIVDLESQKSIIENFLHEKSINNIDFFFIKSPQICDNLSNEEITNLNNLIKKRDINAVIISTEPLAHFKYVKWALEQNLHILMDKPITTEVDVSTDPIKAKKLYSDYLFLKKLYESVLKHKNLTFILQAQRRHHGGFIKTKELIQEITKKTNCPVTSVEAFHSDGQWRFPKEISEQTYHPYNQGYGKMSHSGYHSLDTSVWFAQSSIGDSSKKYNNFELYAQVVRPVDFFKQFSNEDYRRLFPNISDSDLIPNSFSVETEGHITGELDAHSLIALRNDNQTITNIGIHAIHNGFSQRNWISTEGRDLYKGNGRVRHESYIIEQGPFQCVIVNSFQSHELFKSDIDPISVGGEYHYDIHIFRNSTLFPEYKPYKLITMNEINKLVDRKYERGHQEDARRNCTEEFISSVLKNKIPSEQTSNFLDHTLSTQLLSALYESVSAEQDEKRIVRGVIDQRHE